MNVFTVIGLLLASCFLGWVGLMGAFCAVFHNIGGNGKRHEVVLGLTLTAVCVYGIYVLWSKFSPFALVMVS
ncbi:hypothetical protein [Stutzerimonas nitrititolerans]|uniref:hypothetical protein n=1 Tax=Stutzerimonas nitrititolerans TaxID=2482751 RepID=UPI0028A816F2|nr:hypothetical protein [Stutzerimonas nitrititolerans]